jgi:polysaccharide pyruvyl transferase WcaK-like protein
MYEPGEEGWEDDSPWLEQIKSRFADDPDVVLLSGDLSIIELCELFSRFDLLIGARLHSALIALRAGVPAIHIADTLKGWDIYRNLGLADWIVDIGRVLQSPEVVIDKIERILSDPERFDRVRAAVEPVVAVNERPLLEAVRAVENR